jgi:hypothetical protein
MTWILIAIAAACIHLVVAEVFDWFPWISAKIIRFAAASLPDHFRARWEAEWLAELDAIPGKGISKIVFALSILSGVHRLRMTLETETPRVRSLETDASESEFAYTVYIDGEPGEEGYVVLGEPVRVRRRSSHKFVLSQKKEEPPQEKQSS